MDHYVKGPVRKVTRKTRPNNMSDEDWNYLLESEQQSIYVKEKQIFLYIRGINTTNYPVLSEDLAQSLKGLAFAKSHFENNTELNRCFY